MLPSSKLVSFEGQVQNKKFLPEFGGRFFFPKHWYLRTKLHVFLLPEVRVIRINDNEKVKYKILNKLLADMLICFILQQIYCVLSFITV